MAQIKWNSAQIWLTNSSTYPQRGRPHDVICLHKYQRHLQRPNIQDGTQSRFQSFGAKKKLKNWRLSNTWSFLISENFKKLLFAYFISLWPIKSKPLNRWSLICTSKRISELLVQKKLKKLASVQHLKLFNIRKFLKIAFCIFIYIWEEGRGDVWKIYYLTTAQTYQPRPTTYIPLGLG